LKGIVVLGVTLLALAGCSTSSKPATDAVNPATATTTTSSNASASAGGAASRAASTNPDIDQCRYLSVTEVKQVLAYSGTITATQDSPMGFSRCQYQSPDNGFVGAIVAVQSGRNNFDQQKSLDTGADCTSAGVGEESWYCPKSQQGDILFLAKGTTVSVSVTNIQNILKQQGTDWTQAAIEMAKLVAARL
jgi:hypothetical protein